MAEENYGNNSQLAELVKYISDTMKFPIMGAGGGFAPIGIINFFDASVAPQGWLACDGTTYNIADYPDLATYYASVHGSSNFYGGDGTTTFAVPDLRGEFLRGSGTNSHENQGDGANVGVHQDGTEHNALLSTGNSIVYLDNENKPYLNGDKDFSKDGQYQLIAKGSRGTSTGYPVYTSRPTNTSFLICIKATVAGDPNGHHYSTDEQVAGTDTDGKTVYEKTYTDLSISAKNEWIGFNHNINNFGDLIQVTRCVVKGATFTHNIGGTVCFDISDTIFEIKSEMLGTATVTIQYTKTS